jgi:hypothetical protein
MERDLGASRAAATGALTIGMGIATLAALPVGRAAGPLGASLLYLLLGGYRPVFWTLAGALVVVGAVVAVAAREARKPAAAPGA